MDLTQKQFSALVSVCDTIIPAIIKEDDVDGYWKRKASDLDIPNKIVALISTLSDSEQKEFKKLLSILTVPVLGMTWGGPFKGVQDLQTNQIEKLLNRWANSLSNDLRNAFSKLKKICCLLYFGHSENGTANPNWQSIGYPGPLDYPIDSNYKPFHVNDLTQNTEADVVIIGSGAGGSVVADKLASKGYSVIVLEKGGNFQRNDFNHKEIEMMENLFEKKGLLTSTDGGTLFLAGNTLGGGTTINWAASLRTPDDVLEEWAKDHQNPHFTENYASYFEYIEKKCNVTKECEHNQQNNLLSIALSMNNYHVDVIPRNMKKSDFLSKNEAWKAEGYASLGDKYGQKQGANETFLKSAVENGAQIYTSCTVEKIKIEQGIATGVEVKNSKTNELFFIKAKIVVTAAGALHTPCILKKSGVKHAEIGNNLFIHPAYPVPAVYEHPIDAWYGPMMSTVSAEFSKLHKNYGFRIETPPIHAGLMGVANSWMNGQQFKDDMLKSSRTAVFLVIIRDIVGGKVSMNSEGNLDIQYKMGSQELLFFKKALHETVKLHRLLEAEEISVLHNNLLRIKKNDLDIDKFLNKISSHKWQTNYFTLFSAHQMGTCRMGGNDKKHPVNPSGAVKEVKNLYVADGSLFPSASGVNPMLSIQALAAYVADRIIDNL